MSYIDQETKEKYIPYIIETSGGCDRMLLAFLIESFNEFENGRNGDGGKEYLMKLNYLLSPVQVAVLPLLKNKEELQQKAKEVYDLLKIKFNTKYDVTGTVGKRYRRQDELGTPFCITIDFDTLEDDTVTVRNRDTMKQERIKIQDLINYISKEYEK
ncbi:MAG: His/Gly/Thr/Pro-type tRNA ligase C-terminal domain-containing protein [Candidatus Pacebacteria bacterium]|nr:His/Gly/Thr/Pro-type tRNA ligase C-terminal domain-containing protein [Candidatus Paceibacterota bacterium]